MSSTPARAAGSAARRPHQLGLLADHAPKRHDFKRFLRRFSCAVLGHHVDNHAFALAPAGERRCRCGAGYLRKDGSVTHVRHTLGCFLGHHTYRRLTERDGCHEYVCVQCGHPLVFPAARDPYAHARRFAKRVRYLCAVTGHRVSAVAARHGFVEYACHCGHSFLQASGGHSTIHHPLACRLRGHWVEYVADRAGFAEYVCRRCGHPFCFAEPDDGPQARPDDSVVL